MSTAHPDPAVRKEMDPADVDGELVDDAVDAWHEMPRPMLLDDQMRHILAAALPEHARQVRERIASELEAYVDSRAALGWAKNLQAVARQIAADIRRGES